MKKMLNDHVFKNRLPYRYNLSWPVNPDDVFLRVYVQWEDGEDFKEFLVELKFVTCYPS